MNHTNITLDVQEVTDKGHMSKENCGNYTGFVNSVCEIIKDTAIIYTDFIADIAPITQVLDKVGITSVHFHGELEVKSKLALYRQWANGEVQVHGVIITDSKNSNKMGDEYQSRKYTAFIEQRNNIESFLGAATGSPYIVFISTSGM